ncbi:hypothetical protein [Buttiauxella sp. JUb87]|jgi:hypothetical protein|uniref:hypothetical protein n=1 Tax=Buttiauxella sp. JUb87 TaxID=2485129 RepID=UPI00105EAA9A|nr:hypothetical protein [Buttiauxella sp. JUb87]
MKKLIITSAISVLIIGCDAKAKDTWHYSDFTPTNEEQGQHLYLYRSSGTVTHRAKFDYAQDCELLQRAIQSLEPGVKWFCDGAAR